MPGRKKSVKRQKSGGRKKSAVEKRVMQEMEEHRKFIDTVEERLKTSGRTARDIHSYRTRTVAGTEYETIGLRTLFISKPKAERHASRLERGYHTLILPEGNDLWRVWTSVKPKPNMPAKPSEREVASLKKNFERFMMDEVAKDHNGLIPKGRKAKTLKGIGFSQYDTKWGRRDAVHIGGSLRGKTNYAHPMLVVHMGDPSLLEYQLGWRGNAQKYGIFVEPYDMYTYHVTEDRD